MTYRHTLIRPAFCPLCMQRKDLPPGDRLQYWERDADARKHIEKCHGWRWTCLECDFTSDGQESGYYHLHDAHGYRVPKLNAAVAKESLKLGLRTLSELTATSSDATSECSDAESWDKLMSKFISIPCTPESESTATLSESLPSSGIPPCIQPLLLHLSSDTKYDGQSMLKKCLVECAASTGDHLEAQSAQTVDLIARDIEQSSAMELPSISAVHEAKHCELSSAASDVWGCSYISSPDTAPSPNTPPMGPTVDFVSYASDALLVLDELHMAMDCDETTDMLLPDSPKVPRHNIPLTELMSSVMEAPMGEKTASTTSQLPGGPSECSQDSKPKRTRIKLKVRPAPSRADCQGTDTPQPYHYNSQSPTNSRMLPKIRIKLKCRSGKRTGGSDQDVRSNDKDEQPRKKRRVLLRTR